MTVLLEYLGFSLQGMQQPKSSRAVSTAYTEYIYHQFRFECLYSTAKLTPYLHGHLI